MATSTSTAKELANGLFLVDSALTTVVCANDDMALGVIEAAAETRWRGTSGLLVVGYDNLEEIRPHVVSGTVPVSIDQLTRESSSGLPYTLGLAARRLATLLLTGPLSSARVTADLKLSVTDPTTIRTAVLPFVTNVQQVRVVDLLVLPNASLPVARPHHLSRRALPAHSSQPPDSPTPRVARLPQYVLSKILDNYDTATVPYNEGQTTPRVSQQRGAIVPHRRTRRGRRAIRAGHTASGAFALAHHHSLQWPAELGVGRLAAELRGAGACRARLSLH